jgi:hypothetical protein
LYGQQYIQIVDEVFIATLNGGGGSDGGFDRLLGLVRNLKNKIKILREK